jgi:hypothetical protein
MAPYSAHLFSFYFAVRSGLGARRGALGWRWLVGRGGLVESGG